MTEWDTDRRNFLRMAGAAAVGLVLPAHAAGQAENAGTPASNGAEPVPPTEDLMRQHGVLRRIFLVYEETLKRLAARRQDVKPEVAAEATRLVRRFIQDLHERLEENYLFPRFEKLGEHADLVRVLRQQHQQGRLIIDAVLDSATPTVTKNVDQQDRMSNGIRLFIHMYRQHAAREDTVLFPAFRRIASPAEMALLGRDIARKEYQLFGENGFDGIVAEVAQLERALGIHDLGVGVTVTEPES